MCAAPAGLLGLPLEEAFQRGAESAAVTHTHPTGYLTAGFLAAAVGALRDGASLDDALDAATDLLVTRDDHEETLTALTRSRELAAQGDPTPEKLESLGAGWIAEEALALAVYAALSHPRDLGAALLLAVNHSGDCDSTGAIAGNLLGVHLGEEAIPTDWLENLEARETLEQVADDLARWAEGVDIHGPEAEELERRYPAW